MEGGGEGEREKSGLERDSLDLVFIDQMISNEPAFISARWEWGGNEVGKGECIQLVGEKMKLDSWCNDKAE